MDKKTDNQTAETIVRERRLEDDARQAKDMLEEFAAWQMKAQAFIKASGEQPQDPVNFLRNVILSYAAKKLENKIVTHD